MSDTNKRIAEIRERLEKATKHYVPLGWIHLQWTVKEGQPNFVA